MIIHRLKASGFRMIGEPIDTTFPTEGRIGILGQNESGKTTLFQAIECALYGLKKGSGPEAERENLVTWGKNEAKLEIEFTSGQNTYNLQRTFNSKNIHRAKLTAVINGVKDRTSAITGLSDVESKIEQITGMDRDSFTKLVYIKQKDLDALKELAKSKREQLVNKVMGIEIFDDASKKVKEDTIVLERELDRIEPRLETVRKNKEEYETKLSQKSSLETNLAKQQPNLDSKTIELENAKTLLAKYDWISSYNSANETECALKGQAQQAEKEIQNLQQLQENANKLSKSLEIYKPEITKLKTLTQNLAATERQQTDSESSIGTLRVQRQEIVRKLGLSDKEVKNLSQDLPAKKHSLLMQFGTSVVVGLVFLAAAFLFTIFLAGASVVLFGVSAYLFSQYLRIDRLMTQNIEIQAIDKQIIFQESQLYTVKSQKATMTNDTPYKTSEDSQNRLTTVSDVMKTELGQGSVEGVEALIQNANQTLATSRRSDPQARKTAIDAQIKAKQAEIQQLQQTKPASTDEIQYSKEQHELLKKQRDTLQNEWNSIKQVIDSDNGTIKQLKQDLAHLEPDFESYPQLRKDFEACKEKIQLQELVNFQLSETSKEMRTKVLPHASLIINRILPTLTSDRYSDFHISEDLKFTVYSYQAGGFKEREIFSGGTQDQFLIALRLAFTQSILDSRVMADKYSLLMDECTSSSDDNRKQGIFEVLQQMKPTFSQIFVIAHEEIATYVDNNIVLERNSHGYTEIKSKSWAP